MPFSESLPLLITHALFGRDQGLEPFHLFDRLRLDGALESRVHHWCLDGIELSRRGR